METAQSMLRDLEQRCTTHSTWLHSIRSMIFRGGGGNSDEDKGGADSLVKRLEQQIILADVQLCSAILTFLTQDLSGMMRGSWLLKRAWKIYQNVYQQIHQLYRDTALSTANNATLHNLPNPKTLLRHSSSTTTNSDWSIASSDESQPPPVTTTSTTTHRKGLVQSLSDYFLSSTPPSAAEEKQKNKKKFPRKSKKNKIPRSKSSPEDIKLSTAATTTKTPSTITPEDVQRLMGAVSFGYGAFQLAVSLLPPSMLRLVSFFGFEGDRDQGLACLQFSRTTTDMRAPLSTIALLWYLTVGNQIFTAESETDSNEKNKNIAQVTAILEESEAEFSQSALFGFFRGRLRRLHKDMPGAIEHFENAYYTSVLPELRLLCLHEMGWCRLIQLDCLNAIDEFHALRVNSEYSKSFFNYLTALCHGVAEKTDDLMTLRKDILESIGAVSPQRDQTQIDQFISKRVELFPRTDDGMHRLNPAFWRFLVYELLFLWNTLDTCSPAILTQISEDCERERGHEPIAGVAHLIQATCEKLRGNSEKAVIAYRDCLKYRRSLESSVDDDETNASFTHISAFAHYKLAMLLVVDGSGRDEAHQLLQTAQNKYKSYDFESRLSLRIHTAIKAMNK